MLIWPRVIVSRLGSVANTSGTARPAAYQRGHPCRSATGATSHQVVTIVASTVAVVSTATVTPTGTPASGRISMAVNGG